MPKTFNMKKYTILLLMLPLLALQCKKDKNKDPEPVVCMEGDTLCELSKLPPITTTGARTFGCLLNGKAWVAYSDAPGMEHWRASYYKNAFQVFGRIYNEKSEIVTSISVGAYNYFFDADSIKVGIDHYGSGNIVKYSDGCAVYRYNKRYDGYMNILRLDTINSIISVTFEFTHIVDRYNLAQEFCGTDTNYITHGRADILFKL
jgi:hypothetical protein